MHHSVDLKCYLQCLNKLLKNSPSRIFTHLEGLFHFLQRLQVQLLYCPI